MTSPIRVKEEPSYLTKEISMRAETADQVNGHINGTKIHGTKNDAAVPFQGEQSYCIANDPVVSKFLDLDNTDERLWVCPHYRDAHFLSATIPRQTY